MKPGVFAEIWVSTDCDEIAKVAAECGALIFRRSAETASHTASSEAGMLEFTNAHPEFDVISLVQVRKSGVRFVLALFGSVGSVGSVCFAIGSTFL